MILKVNSGTLPEVNSKFKAKAERKRAEEDARLLANRIALLKQEEMKSIKHIGSTTKKAMQIYINKIQLEKKTKVLEDIRNAKNLELEKTREIRLKSKDENMEKKKQYLELKNKRIEDMKMYKNFLEETVKNKRQDALKKNQARRNLIAINLKEGKEKIMNFQNSKISLVKNSNILGIRDEEKATKQILNEIDKMEKLEMELLNRLQTTQPIQEKAMEQLQNALNLKPQRFESLYKLNEEEAKKLLELTEVDISKVKDKLEENGKESHQNKGIPIIIGIEKAESISNSSLQHDSSSVLSDEEIKRKDSYKIELHSEATKKEKESSLTDSQKLLGNGYEKGN